MSIDDAVLKYGKASVMGINPIINPIIYLLKQKHIISKNICNLLLSISSIASYGAIVFGISYAVSKYLKLSGIIAGWICRCRFVA
ncbi:MAG: hypothetical protein HRK26_00900 [Rickettsiaceae bacterium H1]|nr:hypothetical protein [Rickettsiaceae bacterium H1]